MVKEYCFHIYILRRTKYLMKWARIGGLTILLLVILMMIVNPEENLRSTEFGEEHGKKDPYSAEMTKILRQRILPPSRLPYNLTKPLRLDPSEGQVEIIRELLGDMRNGVYIESGAYIGEALSNTLYFERERGWEGLLIEPDVKNFEKLQSKQRKAYISKSCLSQSSHSMSVIMKQARVSAAIVDNFDYILDTGIGFQSSQCFPLYSFMLALNFTTVDYFSLDVEGVEFKVLINIPWDKVNIRTISVEYTIIPEKNEDLVEFMASKGYVLYMDFRRSITSDYIFVQKVIIDQNKGLSTRDLPIILDISKTQHLNLKEDWNSDLFGKT